MADKQLWQVIPVATDVKNDDGVIIGGQTAGTRYAPLTLIANFVHNKWAAFINAITPLKTSFASGDKIPVVNGSAVTAMEASKLLELTAQNALAKYTNPPTDSSPFNNLDSYPMNSVVLVSNGSGVAHNPSVEGFTVSTFGANEDALTQILSSLSKKTYIRSKFGSGATWGGWMAVEQGNQIVVNPSISSSPYNDLNEYPLHSIVQISSNAGSVLHVPNNAMTSMNVLTYGASKDMAIQVLNANDKRTYVRSKFGSGATWGEWLKLSNGVEIVLNPAINAPYDNLNSYPLNSIVQVSSGAGSITNVPDSTLSSINAITLGASDSLSIQFVNASDKRTYVRSKFGSGATWGGWIKIANGNEFAVNPTTTSTPYNDLNTFPRNSLVCVTTSTSAANVSNKPTNEGFGVYTFGAHNDVQTQILQTASKKTYIRTKWGNWSSWTNITDVNPCDVLSAFTNIVCIGDSLTYSAVWYGAPEQNAVRQAYKPYPTILGNITGATITTFATGGDSAKGCWDRYQNQFVEKTNALAIVYLGTNQGFTDTLDEDAPDSLPYTQWAETNTGSLAKIVAKLQDENYKVLLVKPWIVSTGADLAISQKVVTDVATRFNCAVVGPISNSALEFHYWPNRQGTNTAHYNDLGYSWFAHKLVQEVASLGESLKWIIPS